MIRRSLSYSCSRAPRRRLDRAPIASFQNRALRHGLTFIASVLALSLTACATGEDTAKKPEPHAATPVSAADGPPLAPRPLKRPQPMQLVVLADPQKPLLTFRLVFKAGSIDDPKGKEGLTALTSRILAEGGTRELSSSQLLDALFPMAGEIEATSDKEMTAFVGRIHENNLERFLKIFGDVLLEPRFDPKELERLRTDALNSIRNQLRGEDDEELGKVALDALLYQGHPYEHHNAGTIQGLQSITLDDVKAHWKNVFTQDRLVVGMGGNITDAVRSRLLERLAALPQTGAAPVGLPPIAPRGGRVWIIEKPVLSTAISLGYSYPLRRDDPDFFPMALALSYLGEHRQFIGVLFSELRDRRGLNYGDYAYPEHFLQHGFGTFALTNIARTQQDFSIWIRPVESPNALFASRGAVYFLDRLIREGISREGFELTRGFLLGYTRLWEQTDSRRLGYAIDDLFYRTPNFLESYRRTLQSMTLEQVNAAVKRNLSVDRLDFVYVAPDAEALKKLLIEQPPSPIEYATPKPPELLEVDKRILGTRIPVKPDRIEIIDVSTFMERVPAAALPTLR
jgi:zinc protease